MKLTSHTNFKVNFVFELEMETSNIILVLYVMRMYTLYKTTSLIELVQWEFLFVSLKKQQHMDGITQEVHPYQGCKKVWVQ